jgi:hypothetical protein
MPGCFKESEINKSCIDPARCAQLEHLLKTQPSHFPPQKGKGFVEGVPWPRGVTTIKKSFSDTQLPRQKLKAI